ncbi:transmembrane channel-like protein 3, partial [Trichonephila inaurata madagascariensis]
MAENSRMSKLSEKDDECTFAWKLFTGWDYMIGNPETAYNKVASLVMGFKEAILEEKEKKKEVKSWKLISIRVAANFAVFILLASSAYAVVLVVTRSQEPEAQEDGTWYRQNEALLLLAAVAGVCAARRIRASGRAGGKGVVGGCCWRLLLLAAAAWLLLRRLLCYRALLLAVVVEGCYRPRQPRVTLVVSFISLLFPNLFDMIGMAEKYHPRVQLRWQLARILLLYLLNLYTLIFALFAKVYKTTNELQDLAKNITEMIDAQNSSVRHTRSLLEAIGSVDETESTTLLSPYNCTYIIIHNCTLAAFYAGINLTDYLVTTSTSQPNASSVDGDYFLDNSTSEDDLAYDNLIGNIANLTAFGMASWNVSSSAPVGPHIALPPVFFNVSSALDLEEGKMTWDIPLDYVSEPPENWTFWGDFNDSLSTLTSYFSTTFLYNETTTSHSTTTNEDESSSSATDSPWPPDLNCTIAIPICTADPTSFHDPSFTTTEDGTTTEEFDFTINGTDPFENATFQPSCPKYEFDEDAPCPSRCMVEEKKSRMPTTEDLLIIPDEMKDLLRKKCWETAFGQVSES